AYALQENSIAGEMAFAGERVPVRVSTMRQTQVVKGKYQGSREESPRYGNRRFLLFLLLCPVAGPAAAFGDYPACRGPRPFGARRLRRTLAGACRRGLRLHRGCRV